MPPWLEVMVGLLSLLAGGGGVLLVIGVRKERQDRMATDVTDTETALKDLKDEIRADFQRLEKTFTDFREDVFRNLERRLAVLEARTEGHAANNVEKHVSLEARVYRLEIQRDPGAPEFIERETTGNTPIPPGRRR